jgi:RNA polymerase sigma-70 factor (ECF subfamily)
MRSERLNDSDAGLLGRCHSDPEAFAVFYRRHERLVVGWLMRQTRQPELAADLTAEVFAAAYLAAPPFRDGPEPAGAWLLGIARNKLRHSRRRDQTETSARRRLALEPVVISDESIARLEAITDTQVAEILDLLPGDQRDAVRARVVDELGYDELASRANVSETVVRKRVSRGLAALRRLLEQPGGSQ